MLFDTFFKLYLKANVVIIILYDKTLNFYDKKVVHVYNYDNDIVYLE